MTEIKKIVEELSGLTIMQATELTSALQKKWGVNPHEHIDTNGDKTLEAANEKKKRQV